MEDNKNVSSVIPATRLQMLEDYIKERGNAKISDLAAALLVSESTVRRDLDELVKNGSIQRCYGGATWVRHESTYGRYSDKILVNEDKKKRIGKFCADMVEPGDTIFLDSGTTTYQIGVELKNKKNLTIFTYDMAIASMISFDSSTTVVVTGGVKKEDYNVLTGSMTEEFISNIRFKTLFLSADAVDEEFGVSNTALPEATIKSKLVKSAGKVVLAVDSSKFEKAAMIRVCGLEKINCIVTDSDIDGKISGRFSDLVPEFYAV